MHAAASISSLNQDSILWLEDRTSLSVAEVLAQAKRNQFLKGAANVNVDKPDSGLTVHMNIMSNQVDRVNFMRYPRD